MGWLEKQVNRAGRALKKDAQKAEHWISKRVPHQHAKDRRAANKAAAEQISYYKEQKQMMHEEKAKIDEEKKQQKVLANTRQVKSLRRSTRAPGFMEASAEGYSDKLGD